HPELLEDLADEFIRSGYDVRKLVKSIVLSKPYQLSSLRAGGEEAASRLFSQASVAPLLPEQLFESIVRATGYDDVKPNPKGGKSAAGGESFREAFFREFKGSLQPNEPALPVSEPTISQALYFL